MAGRGAILPLLLAACLAAACGGSSGSPTTPTPPPAPPAPTPTPPTPLAALSVSVSPTPLVAVSDPGGAADRYRVTANLTFQETAGRAARVSALQVTITSPAGMRPTAAWNATVRVEVTIPIEAKGSVPYTLPTAFDAGGPDPAARWRLDVTAADQDGEAITVAPVEVSVTVPPPPVMDAVFVGAGDMAGCGLLEPEATAKLLDRIPGTVFTAGDNVYPSGTPSNYSQCYAPTWGRHLWRTFASAGNHDYYDDAGASYYAYFGPAAGPPGLGYYSHTLGSWHVVVLNSNLRLQSGTPQYEWVRQDLAASREVCTIAIWHHPLFSSGENGNSDFMRDVWRLLVQSGVDVVINGHDHTYERFAPQDADGRPDPRGIRQFVVGTGGYALYKLGRTQRNSEVFENRTYGVLKLTLKSMSYDWAFVPIDGQSFRDVGSGTCVTPSLR